MCQVEGSFTRWPCNRAATFAVTIGCVHEHLTTEPMCSGHLDKIGDGEGVCSFCQDCSEPHDCVVALLRQEALT
jgi:hypothetical protein